MSNIDEIDLWENEEESLPKNVVIPESEKTNNTIHLASTSSSDEFDANSYDLNFEKSAKIEVWNNKTIVIGVKGNLRKHPIINSDLNSINGLEESEIDGGFVYFAPLTAVNAFVFRHILKKVKTEADANSVSILKEHFERIWTPTVRIADTGKHVEVNTPHIRVYTDILKKVNAYPAGKGYRVSIARVLDLEALCENSATTLPKFEFNEEVVKLSRDPLQGFDGSLNSLKTIPISELNVITTNLQNMKSLKNSKKTLTEKFESFGISNLYELLFTLPKRFIDKSNPQEFSDLMEGESVTIVGSIEAVNGLPNNMGVYFTVDNGRGRKIKCNFWRQQWLKTKFNVGDEVLLTGKVTRFRGKIELGGSSIEHSEEAAVLPIVPIYRQSETRGVTTQLIKAAAREMIARAGKINLPEYLKEESRLEYTQALTELHFPTSLELFKQACDDLAYYELVYMQLIMLEEKTKEENKVGIPQKEKPRNLQNVAVKSLPFTLTNAQVKSVKKINELLEKDVPSQVLLNGEVGSGKTLVAQLSCLKSIDAGYQSVLLGPTEILARQLYDGFIRLNEGLKKFNSEIEIVYVGGGMKAAEKREVLAKIKNGEVDVIVGTTGVLGKSVKYNNLGIVVVDEQQKFGAEQRSQLLNSRADGRIPDLLLMSATPIPRSTAQVFYGDMEMVLLDEKPPGRLPIITEWICEDPIDFSHQIANKVWSDVQLEAANGNQTFVITPMVVDSDKVDAASVERTFESLSKTTLAGLNVGYVHGKLTKDEQKEVMTDFRNKKYDVLVSSTVVEVGVDIPDATRVVVLSADRLGAASLHQIRGRVGRNSKQSKCYLVSLGKTDNSQLRLNALVNSENGFEIALSDLEIRGEGKIFGTEQSGSSEMIFASLARHRNWIEPARNDANRILSSKFRDIALTDARNRFESAERNF